MADWLTEEREVELIDMWQARPVLYEEISKGYSNRNKRMVALNKIARRMFIISYNYDAWIAALKTFVV